MSLFTLTINLFMVNIMCLYLRLDCITFNLSKMNTHATALATTPDQTTPDESLIM